MSWTHSSKGVVLGVLLAISLMAVGTAAALSVSGTAPAPAETGEEVTMNATITQPFQGTSDQWTLRGETQLQGAEWEIEVLNQGRLVTRQGPSGSNFTQPLDFEDGATTVNVTVTGTAPSLSTFNYQNMSVENYTVMRLTQQNGSALEQTWQAHRYTNDSRSARQAIDAAQNAVEEADGSAGEDDLDRAINAYDAGNFDNAESLAQEAQSAAEESQGGLPIALIGGVVVVLLLVVGGGYYYYQSQQGSEYKLQ